MELSATKRLELLEEIIADSGGIENIDLHSELAKRVTAIKRQNIAQTIPPAVTAQSMMQNNGVLPSNTNAGGTISGQVDGSATQDPNAVNQVQNAPISPNTPPGM